MTVDDVLALLGDWSKPHTPLSNALADKLVTLIRQGELPADMLLPAERLLAYGLGISRTTVAAAYEQLKDRGLAESQVGHGTWVCADNGPAAPTPPSYGVASDVFYSDLGASSTEVFDLTLAAPLPGPWLADAIPDATERLASLATYHNGYEPAGLPDLRQRIADLNCTHPLTAADQIIVTSGGTQAISLLIRTLASPGSTVLCEELTCPSALTVFRHLGVRIVPLAMDQSGITTHALERALGRLSPALLYLTPTFHNPTAGTIDADRRHAIVALAEKHNVPIVEDLSLADLSLDLTPPPPLANDPSARQVFSIGSLSKLYWPGLRVGWIRLPRQCSADIAGLKAVEDFGTPLPTQTLALALLNRHNLIKQQRRAELLAKRDLLIDLLTRALPGWTIPRPAGGLSLWAEAPTDIEFLRQQGMRQGVIPLTDQHFWAGTELIPTRHIRVPYTMDADKLTVLAARLGEIWAHRKQ